MKITDIELRSYTWPRPKPIRNGKKGSDPRILP